MFKVALNAGHHRYNPKRCLKTIDTNETREWVLNARICEKVERLLTAYDGYELLRIDDRTGETDIPLKKGTGKKTRMEKANEWGADIYIAVHHNGGINGGKGGGIVVYTYTKVSSATKALQKAMYDTLIKYTGLKGNRATPLGTANFAECRETKMPAVLLECGFMDSTVDTPIILTEDYADKCAAAITEVIVEKGGLKKKAVATDYRANVLKTCEFEPVTAKYLDAYRYSNELYRALWQCLREGKKRTRG